MSEGQQGLIVLCLICILSAFIWHIYIKKYSEAVIKATITSAIIFQIANYIHVGYLDPFVIISIIVSAILAFIISLIVGYPFLIVRRKNK